MKKLFLAGFGLLLLTPVYADQFAYIKPDLAKKAVELLNKEKDIYLFCEPCGELQGKIEQVRTVEEFDVNYEGYHEVRINGGGIDLAYTFIRRGARWKNVAVELGLKPSGVSGEIAVGHPPKKVKPDL